MRVFYIDEDELKQSKRCFYVKVDNINVPEELKGYKALEASTTEELKAEIINYYKFKKPITIQLWTNRNCSGKRIDQLDTIPLEYEFVYVYAVINKDNN
jgi:hypothetical protein